LILAHAGAFGALAEQSGRSGWYWLLFALPAVIAFVTPFYMTRCWMLTFWGKPRNQHLYDHAHETPILYVPLIVLAGLAIISGYTWFGPSALIKASMREATIIARAVDKDHPFDGFASAWPLEAPKSPEEARAEGDPVAGEHGLPHPIKAEAVAEAHGEDPLHHGHELVEKYIAWAFIVGIGAGFLVYMNGYRVAALLTARGPLALVRIWLYRRMYFDELYFALLVNTVLLISWISATFDKYVVDGLVNGAAWAVRGASRVIGLNDTYVVDGAVNGIASVTQDLGAAVRAPQTGRIRAYVTILMAAVAIGLAVAIIVTLS
jgi:NADH-quinone oxidoreductase subunit L